MEMTQTINSTMTSYTTFRIGKNLFGTDVLNVREISTELSFAHIYHAPDQIKGYVNIRGQLYLIVDLKKLLDPEDDTPPSPNQCIVLFKDQVAPSLGILVDAINDIVDFDTDQIEERRQSNGATLHESDRRDINISSGICKLPKELLIILNIDNLIASVKNYVE